MLDLDDQIGYDHNRNKQMLHCLHVAESTVRDRRQQ